LLATGMTAGIFAQGGPILYSPVRQIGDQNIALRPWGSGTIAETQEIAYEGVNSLRVSTRNPFMGGVVLFNATPDLSSSFQDKHNLLRFAVRVADGSLTLGGGTPPPGAGGRGDGGDMAGLAGGPPGALGQGGRGGGPGGLGQAGAPPGVGGQGAQATGTPALRTIRFVITTTDGKKSEAYVPLTTGGAGERGWRHISLPLQAITGFERTNKIIKEIAFSGDDTATFYVGDIRVINDTTPITGSIMGPERHNLALGDEIDLIGQGFGGSSVLRYIWTFSREGEAGQVQPGRVDAEGQAIRRRFRQPGTYTVTLTVLDKYGLKNPHTSSIRVVVNP
jgi:hypothetical protein